MPTDTLIVWDVRDHTPSLNSDARTDLSTAALGADIALLIVPLLTKAALYPKKP